MVDSRGSPTESDPFSCITGIIVTDCMGYKLPSTTHGCARLIQLDMNFNVGHFRCPLLLAIHTVESKR